MSGVRAATILALWGAAYRAGISAPDAVLGEFADAGRTAGVRAADAATAARVGLPGPGEANAGSVALLDLLRRGGCPDLLLPVAGDVRGFAPRSAALVPALDAGGAVGLPTLNLTVVPGDGHWRVFPSTGAESEAPAQQPRISLFDAERDLDAAIRTATSRLTRLDIARGADGVRDGIAAAMRRAAVNVPPGDSRAHRHGAALLAKVVSLEALLQVAATHDAGANTRHELASMDDALRPLAAAVRAGRLAAVGELVTDLDVRGSALGGTARARVAADRDGDHPN